MENVKLNFVHLCDLAFFSQEGKMNIIGDFDRIYSEKIPNANVIFHSFFIVSNFTAPAGRYTQKIIMKKDTQEILRNESTRETSEDGKIGFIGNFGVTFPDYGDYKVEIYINDNKEADLPLKILKFERK